MPPDDLQISSKGMAIDRPFPAKLALYGSLAVLLVSGAVAFSAAVAHPAAIWAFMASLIGAVTSAGALVQRRLDPVTSARSDARRRGEVAIVGDRLVATDRGGTRIYRRSAITGGWMERVEDTSTVVLVTASGDVISAEIDDDDDGHRLLAAVGVAPHQQVMRTRLAPPLSRHAAMGCVVIPLSIFAAVGLVISAIAVMVLAHDVIAGPLSIDDPRLWKALGILALFGAGFFAIALGLVPVRLVIGHDGIAIRGLFRRRFVPHASVARVAQSDLAVELTLRGGGVVRLPVEERFTDGETGVNPVLAAIHSRLYDAMNEASGESAAAKMVDLDRAGRPLSSWRDHLISLGKEKASYRRVALAPEDIAAVVADVSAPRERRIAAALALSASGDEDARTRVRVAASACADEPLRIAIEAAAEDELSEETLSRALAG